jgi:AcrR family transcriptional regulator
MDSNTIDVKPKRRYNSSGRREQAQHTREAILEVARRLLLADGYAATTVAAIARASNVSVETIYKSFGGKPGLVRAIYERGLEGAGPVPAEQRSDAMRAAEADPRTIIENWATFVTEVAPRSALISLLIRTAAASEPEMATLLETTDRLRLARMEHNARDLFERGLFRADITLDEARDVLWLYSSPELYELLVIRRNWPIDRYGRFVAGGMIAALLPARAS